MCNLTGYLVKSPFMMREARINNGQPRILKGCADEEDDFHVITQCTNNCKEDCKFKYYISDKKVIKAFDWAISSIFIRHNGMPDIFVRHIPEITFLSFISNFGGLLGMWLGLSMFTILKSITFQFYNMINNFNNKHRKNVQINNLIQVNLNRGNIKPCSCRRPSHVFRLSHF